MESAMELTLEQQSAIERGEAVTMRFPNLNVECVVINKERFEAIEEEAQLQHDLHHARKEFQRALPSAKLHDLAKTKKPPEAWFQEDFSYLDSDAS
jgi:hypothetical protein